MALAIGLRIPREIWAQGIESVAPWARSNGLGSLDLPSPEPSAVEVLRRESLVLGSIDAPGTKDLLSRDPERQRKGLAAWMERIDQAATVGGKVLFSVLSPAEPMPRRDSLELWKQVFPPVVEHLEARGVSLAVEGWPGPFPHYANLGTTPEVLRAMFQHCPSPHFGLCYDPSHLVRLGIDYLRFLDEFGDRVRHCHGKDTEIMATGLYDYGHFPAVLDKVPANSEGYWRYCVPGDGVIDWQRVAFRLELHGYTGPIAIELEDHRFGGGRGAREQQEAGVLKAVRHLARVTA